MVAGTIDFVPTCGPSGVLILTMLPAGAFHAFPERMGSVNDSTSSLDPCWIDEYNS